MTRKQFARIDEACRATLATVPGQMLRTELQEIIGAWGYNTTLSVLAKLASEDSEEAVRTDDPEGTSEYTKLALGLQATIDRFRL